jgi:hypothetical protein
MHMKLLYRKISIISQNEYWEDLTRLFLQKEYLSQSLLVYIGH